MNKGQSSKLDREFQQKVSAKYGGRSLLGGKCEVVHHWFGRANKAVRWWIPNGIPLTHEQHQALHNGDQEIKKAIIKKLGKRWLTSLFKEANKIKKYDQSRVIGTDDTIQ